MAKPKLLLMSHGGLAVEIHTVLKQFTGESENISSINMDYQDGTKKMEQDLDNYLKENNEKEIIIITDIYGGSPFNIAVKTLLGNEKLRLITGLNLPMLLEYSFTSYSNIDEVVGGILKAGSEAIKSIGSKDLLIDQTDDDEIEIE